MEQRAFHDPQSHIFRSHFCLQVIRIFKTVIRIFTAPLCFLTHFWQTKLEGCCCIQSDDIVTLSLNGLLLQHLMNLLTHMLIRQEDFWMAELMYYWWRLFLTQLTQRCLEVFYHFLCVCIFQIV